MGLLGDGLKAGASVLGSALGGSATKKAAKIAAKAQKEVAQMNNDLAREFRRENTANLSPFMNRGNVAGAYINALLGLPGAEYTTQAQQPVSANGFATISGPFGISMQIPNRGQQAAQTTTRVNPVTAQRAFNTYRNGTGYQFRVNEGLDALNNGYAAKGALRSGAAMKDFMRFGQGIASDEFGRYLGYLGGQQGVGMQGAGAIAGVGLNALNAMSANNQSAADATSNAALIRGTANSNMWAGIGNTLGNMFGSSFSGGGGLDQTIRTPSGMDALVSANLSR